METLTASSKADLVELLGNRYGRKKSSIYEWFNRLNTSTPKQDGNYIISSEDLARLDNLNEWITAGNKLVDYPEIKNKSAIATVENQAIEEATVPLHGEGVPNEFTQLIRAAQEKGAGLAIAQNLIAQQFASNPDLLPHDLRQQVKESEQAIAPKFTAQEYASRFMSMATAA